MLGRKTSHGITRKPSCFNFSAKGPAQVITQTSAPASCALRASGRRRAQKEKSSATRNKIFQDALYGAGHTSKGTSWRFFPLAGASRDHLASAHTSTLSMLPRQLSFA